MNRGTFGILVAGLLAGIPKPVEGWSNGVDGPDSYGTHDWILDQAVEVLGPDAGWVRLGVALRATDDPDTVDGIDHASGTWWHVWDEWGATWGGAPEAADVWFRRTLRRLRDGNERGASKALGILAHIVGDAAQPMHTDGLLEAEDRVHSSYESAVDGRSERGDPSYRFRYDGPAMADPYDRTVRVARGAHRYYVSLVREYDRNGYNDEVHRITRRQLDRAADALADLILTISRRAA